MGDLLRRHSLLITAILLFACSFQLMGASIRNPALPRLGGRLIHGIISPMQHLHHDVVASVHHVWRHYIWLVNLESERGDLLRRIKALEAQNSRLVEYRTENERLRKLVNFVEKGEQRGVAATVTGRDPSNWVSTVTIDRGRADGVESGYPVVDGNAIVGQTTVVTEHSAKVLLLTDQTSAIDVIVQDSRAPGVAEGTGKSGLRLRYVLKQYDVKPGDRVIASGLGGVFPKGTLIGVVTDVDPNTPGLFQTTALDPSVDLNRLENVLVLMPSTEAQAAPRVHGPVSLEGK